MKKESFLQKSACVDIESLEICHTMQYHSSQGGILLVQNGSAQLTTINDMIEITSSVIYIMQSHCDYHIQPLTPLSITFITWDNYEFHIKQKHPVLAIYEHSLLQALLTSIQAKTYEPLYQEAFLSSIATLSLTLLIHDYANTLSICEHKETNHACAIINEYLYKHYANNISLDLLADLVHMNKYALVHLYKDYSHHTIIEELTQIRCQKAAVKLQTSDTTIKEIAQSCGFTSASYFIQVFQKYYHQTPLQYRKAYRRKQKNLLINNEKFIFATNKTHK